MTITASPRQTVLLRANLPAATEALAQIAGRGPQLNQSSSINKAALDFTHLIIPPHSIKQPVTSIRHHSARPAPQAKSP
jgi:hypothetical protein